MSGELRAIQTSILAPAATVTATGNGSSFDLLNFDGHCQIVLTASATGGAGQTLDVKIQHSANGTDWTDSGIAFAQVTNAAASVQTLYATIEQFHRYIRVVDTMAGTTPTVARAVVMAAKARKV